MRYYNKRSRQDLLRVNFMNILHDVTTRPRQALRNTLSNRHTVGKILKIGINAYTLNFGMYDRYIIRKAGRGSFK